MVKGGWLDGVLVSCSPGNDKKCYALSEDGSQWNEIGTMTNKRWLGSGVVIKDKNGGPDKLWQLGEHKSGEFIYANGTIVEQDWPFAWRFNRPCMVQIESGEILIIGGVTYDSSQSNNRKTVYRWNPEDNTFVTQQPMNQQREAGTCALFRSAAHGG